MSNHQGGVSQQQIFEMLMESQYWSREQMQGYQHSQLEQMLRHAKANVPFYKTRLNCMFRRDGSINWDRWEEIPILTKEEVRQNFEGLQATEIPAVHGAARQHTTSGTTSFPITVLHSELEEALWRPLEWRSHTWWKLDWSRNLMRWQSPGADDNPDASFTRYGAWGPPWLSMGRETGLTFAMARNAPLETRLAALRASEIGYLAARIHLAYVAALHVAEKRYKPKIHLEAVLGYSASVEAQHEEACLSGFGAIVRSSYSSTECGRIAYSCHDNGTYHISEECVLCEIVDAEGEVVGPNQFGDMIVTPFLCAAMPLIRYSQGDLAKWKDGCSCGVGLRSIAKIQGRLVQLFKLPDGKMIAPNVAEWIRTTVGILGWQFAQIGSDKVEMRYIRRSALSAEQQAWASQAMDSYFNKSFKFSFNHVDSLGESGSGKFILYVNEYSPLS